MPITTVIYRPFIIRFFNQVNFSVHYFLSSSATASFSPTLLGPAVRLLLAHYNLEPNNITQHSGPKNNLIKGDVLAHIRINKLTPVNQLQQVREEIASSKKLVQVDVDVTTATKQRQRVQQRVQSYVDISLTNMRQTIAKRLTQCKQNVPHNYMATKIPVDGILELRKKYNTATGSKLSLNDFVVKASALALKSVPEINVQWKDGNLRRMHSVDISVAVATHGGILLPILFDADQLDVRQISTKAHELAQKARDGKLRPEEFQGGTFTISNVSMFDAVANAVSIINPPQAAIIVVCCVQKRAVVTYGQENEPKPATEQQVHFTLSYDTRAIQQLDAERFLHSLRTILGQADPALFFTQEPGITDEEVPIRKSPYNIIDTMSDEDIRKLAARLL